MSPWDVKFKSKRKGVYMHSDRSLTWYVFVCSAHPTNSCLWQSRYVSLMNEVLRVQRYNIIYSHVKTISSGTITRVTYTIVVTTCTCVATRPLSTGTQWTLEASIWWAVCACVYTWCVDVWVCVLFVSACECVLVEWYQCVCVFFCKWYQPPATFSACLFVHMCVFVFQAWVWE